MFRRCPPASFPKNLAFFRCSYRRIVVFAHLSVEQADEERPEHGQGDCMTQLISVPQAARIARVTPTRLLRAIRAEELQAFPLRGAIELRTTPEWLSQWQVRAL